MAPSSRYVGPAWDLLQLVGSSQIKRKKEVEGYTKQYAPNTKQNTQVNVQNGKRGQHVVRVVQSKYIYIYIYTYGGVRLIPFDNYLKWEPDYGGQKSMTKTPSIRQYFTKIT